MNSTITIHGRPMNPAILLKICLFTSCDQEAKACIMIGSGP